jgi:hypothetical protein
MAGTSATAALSPKVVRENTLLIQLGWSGTAIDPSLQNCRISINADGDTITATAGGSSGCVPIFEVIEFYPGVIRRMAQGTLAIGTSDVTVTGSHGLRVLPKNTILVHNGVSSTATGTLPATYYRTRIDLSGNDGVFAVRAAADGVAGPTSQFYLVELFG